MVLLPGCVCCERCVCLCALQVTNTGSTGSGYSGASAFCQTLRDERWPKTLPKSGVTEVDGYCWIEVPVVGDTATGADVVVAYIAIGFPKLKSEDQETDQPVRFRIRNAAGYTEWNALYEKPYAGCVTCSNELTYTFGPDDVVEGSGTFCGGNVVFTVEIGVEECHYCCKDGQINQSLSKSQCAAQGGIWVYDGQCERESGSCDPSDCEPCEECEWPSNRTENDTAGNSVDCGTGGEKVTQVSQTITPAGSLPAGVSWQSGFPGKIESCNWAIVEDKVIQYACYADCEQFGTRTTTTYRLMVINCTTPPSITDITSLALSGSTSTVTNQIPAGCSGFPDRTRLRPFLSDPEPICNEFP